MCAVIGAYVENPTKDDINNLTAVFLESSIRGLHATGISWVQYDKINTYIESNPARKALENIDLQNCINEDGNLYLIGHCRYSTSDLAYNQPLWDDDISIVHNGVITQETPDVWEQLYGYKCKTRNDSELILHTIVSGKSPLEKFPDSSISVVELYREKKLRFYRNGKRPIYFTSLNNGVVVTSTKDIAIRAGLKGPNSVDMNTYHTITKNQIHKHPVLINNAKDLQS